MMRNIVFRVSEQLGDGSSVVGRRGHKIESSWFAVILRRA